jgi:acetyl esterase/lipase
MGAEKYLFLLLILFKCVELQEVIDLWNGNPPYDNGDNAELTVFLPEEKVANGRAVIICPGGGYDHLAFEKEGTAWASFFNEEGIAVFVLKYRMPKGDYRVPISDAEEAIKLVRRNAEKWFINTKRVGIMGSSAGGHLASTVATHSNGKAKPDFQILFYPVITMDPTYTHLGSMKNFLGEKPKEEMINEYSNEKKVDADTPRAFIVLSNDDTAVPPLNSVNYYLECNANKVSVSLHIYPTGGHGWGSLTTFAYHYEVLQELKMWLKSF